MARFTVVLSLLLLALVPAAWAQVAVDHCGQHISGSGFLVQDLDCPTTEPAVTMTSTGILELGGFSIHGGEYGIQCLRSCSVIGPGVVSGAEEDGIGAIGHLMLSNMTSTGNGFAGGKAGRSALVLDSDLEGNQHCGVESLGTLRAKRSMMTGNGCGAYGDRSARLSEVTATGNAVVGVLGSGIGLVDSTVTGNGSDPRCGVEAVCADVIAFLRPPRLRNSTCGTSATTSDPPTGTWGVCSAD